MQMMRISNSMQSHAVECRNGHPLRINIAFEIESDLCLHRLQFKAVIIDPVKYILSKY